MPRSSKWSLSLKLSSPTRPDRLWGPSGVKKPGREDTSF